MKDLNGNRVNLKTIKKYDIIYYNDYILVYSGRSKYNIRLYELIYDTYEHEITKDSGVTIPDSLPNYKYLNRRLFWGYGGIERNMILLEHSSNKPALEYIIDKYKNFNINDYKK